MLLGEIPLDWSMKTKTTIVSKFPFEWTRLNLNEDTKVISSFANDSKLDDGAQIYKYLCRWVHNEQYPTSFGPLIAKLLVKERSKLRLTDIEMADLCYFKDKEQQWRLAFKSAYRMLRHGESNLLIYINSSFGVIFENIDGEVTAKMTKSTFGFRTLLRQQGIAC
jgi:hypothetical protein